MTFLYHTFSLKFTYLKKQKIHNISKHVKNLRHYMNLPAII
jgi:hypothetical protein